jgi:CRISPR/Cas system-associated endoribonuclease Cas2
MGAVKIILLNHGLPVRKDVREKGGNLFLSHGRREEGSAVLDRPGDGETQRGQRSVFQGEVRGEFFKDTEGRETRSFTQEDIVDIQVIVGEYGLARKKVGGLENLGEDVVYDLKKGEIIDLLFRLDEKGFGEEVN